MGSSFEHLADQLRHLGHEVEADLCDLLQSARDGVRTHQVNNFEAGVNSKSARLNKGSESNTVLLSSHGDAYTLDAKGRISTFVYDKRDGASGHGYRLHYDAHGNVNLVEDHTDNKTWIYCGDRGWSADGGRSFSNFGDISVDENGLHVTGDSTSLKIPDITDPRRRNEDHFCAVENANGDCYHVNERQELDEFQYRHDQQSFKFHYDSKGQLDRIQDPSGHLWTNNGDGWTTDGMTVAFPASITVDAEGLHASGCADSQEFFRRLMKARLR